MQEARKKTWVTETFVPVDVGKEAFEKAFKARFPEGLIEWRAEFDGDFICDVNVALTQKDDYKSFWEEFCRQCKRAPEYKESRFHLDV